MTTDLPTKCIITVPVATVFLAPVGQTQCVTSACRGRTPKPTIADIIIINVGLFV